MTELISIQARKFLVSGLLIFSVFFAGACATTPMGTAMDKQDTTRPQPRIKAEDWMSLEEWHKRHNDNVAAAGITRAAVVLYGDSIVEAWRWDKSLETLTGKSILALGLGGDMTQQLLWRLDDGETDDLDPDQTITLIGINNFGHQNDTPADVARGVLAVDAKLKSEFEQAERVVLAILPSGEKADDPIRQKIKQANTIVAAQAKARGFQFVDLGPEMLDADGNIPAQLAQDFLHPTAAGFAKLTAALKRALE